MKLHEMRLVWLEKESKYGLAVELEGAENVVFVGRLRIAPGSSAGVVSSAFRNLADSLDEMNKDYGD